MNFPLYHFVEEKMNKMSDKKMSDPITQKDIQKEIEELNDNSKLVYHHGKLYGYNKIVLSKGRIILEVYDKSCEGIYSNSNIKIMTTKKTKREIYMILYTLNESRQLETNRG